MFGTDEIVKLIYQMYDVNGNGFIMRTDLVKMVLMLHGEEPMAPRGLKVHRSHFR